MGFKQKIIITYVLIFLLFVGLMFPFATKSATTIMYNAMEDRADELIEVLEQAPNEVALIATLKEQKPLLFFRATLLNNKGQVLYDSHTKRLLGSSPFKNQPVSHPEVVEALKKGVGYHEEYSALLNQDFAYMAKVFYFHGKEYVIRISFPLRYVMQITTNFRIGFVILSTIVLLLYSILTWIVLNHLTKPIDKIIEAITPYQQGRSTFIPEITLKLENQADEFGRLAFTLNSLTKRIQQQINTLITERREKEVVLETLAEGVVAVDQLGEVTYANTQALRFFRASTPIDVFKSDTHETSCALDLIQRCQEKGAPLGKMLELFLEAQKKFYNLVAVPMKGENGAVLVIQDYTSQLVVIEMKRDFVANASHELRTPITIIQGFAETLQDPERLTPEQIKEVTHKIGRNCERMTRLIKELLLLADIEHLPESQLEKFSLLNLSEKCKDQVLQIYTDANVEINAPSECDYEIIGVPDLIERAIVNLVDNGVKYSNPPAKVTVELSERGEMVEVKVKDFGIGMSAEEMEQIFNRFYRSSEARSSKVSGSGLGLSIVEAIVGKHNGKIYVTSKVGSGSCFTLLFPKKLTELREV